MMGGPMYWQRVMGRNGLRGFPRPYTNPDETTLTRGYMSGELQRLENDCSNEAAINALAGLSGLEPHEAARVVRAIFGQPEPDCENCQRISLRCSDHAFYGVTTEYPIEEHPDAR